MLSFKIEQVMHDGIEVRFDYCYLSVGPRCPCYVGIGISGLYMNNIQVLRQLLVSQTLPALFGPFGDLLWITWAHRLRVDDIHICNTLLHNKRHTIGDCSIREY